MPEGDQPVSLFRSIRTRHPRRVLATAAVALLLSGTARAQGAFQSAMPQGSPFSGGVPQGRATAEPLRLGVLDVVHRALDHNLGVLLAADGIARAGADRRLALSQLMPNVSARMAGTRQVSSLEAFGLPLNDLPPLVGPFNVYDARVFLTQPVFDRRALNDLRADTHFVEASRHSFRSARDLVVLVAANLYLTAGGGCSASTCRSAPRRFS